MSERKIATANGLGFFFFWLLVLLAGADKPPPWGFLWVMLIVALCAALVAWRIPTYIDWSRTKKPMRLPRVAFEGIAAGSVVAIPFALQGSGEPSITMQPIDYVGWFAVMGVMGLLNSLTLYAINAFITRDDHLVS
jgi:hypothetical protein